MFEVADGPLDGHDWPAAIADRNHVGHLAPAVPGAVAGLWAAHRHAGRLPWEPLLAPAIVTAERGLEVTWVLLMEIVARLDEIRPRAALAAILLPQGRLPGRGTADGPGERLDQRELAERCAGSPPRGPTPSIAAPWPRRSPPRSAPAAGSVRGGSRRVRAEGRAGAAGVLSRPAVRDRDGSRRLRDARHPRPFRLAGARAGSAGHYHLLAEAMAHAFADNAAYSDPDFTDDPVHQLGGAEFAAARAAQIRLDRAAPRPIVATAPWLARPRPCAPRPWAASTARPRSCRPTGRATSCR